MKLEDSKPRERDVGEANEEEVLSERKRRPLQEVGNRLKDKAKKHTIGKKAMDKNKGLRPYTRECSPCGKAAWICGTIAGVKGDVWAVVLATIIGSEIFSMEKEYVSSILRFEPLFY